MNKLSKKGKNLAEIDNWLDNLGYYRKNVAYDETCLFRTVSEQLFDCQVYHERVRKECIAFAREHYELFKEFVGSEKEFYERMDKLEKHMVVCGVLELHIVSRKYECDIINYDGKKQTIEHITRYNYQKAIHICLMDDDHFDAIFKKDHIINAGFCQSIVYQIFYENVFGIQNVDNIVRTMLYEKQNLITLSDLPKSEVKDTSENDSKKNDKELPSNVIVAPFPFKVAKALDPNIYRNIEYDSWGDTRRELRLGEWYYGDDKLIQGTRCIYKDPFNNDKLDCYIQEIIRKENKCVVYLTKLACKKTVSYFDLSPEDDAKPWALPWRFTRSLNLSNNVSSSNTDKSTPKHRKRGKDKKRTKSESHLHGTFGKLDPSEKLGDYVGVPLQMHNAETSNLTPGGAEIYPEDYVQEVDSTEEPCQYVNGTLWQPTQWPSYVPHTPDPSVWPPNSPQLPPFNFAMKPMIASAPVTPDVIPYHDPRFPFFFNFPVVEPPTLYPQWSSNGETTSPYVQMEENLYEDQGNQDVGAKQEFEQGVRIKHESNTEEEIPTMNSVPKERVHHLTLSIPPQNATLEMYPPVVPLHAGTPVIYTSNQIQEVPDVLVPSSPLLYSPQIDVQYVPSAPCQFIYPPTPPATWGPSPAINGQGFIFPNPN